MYQAEAKPKLAKLADTLRVLIVLPFAVGVVVCVIVLGLTDLLFDRLSA